MGLPSCLASAERADDLITDLHAQAGGTLKVFLPGVGSACRVPGCVIAERTNWRAPWVPLHTQFGCGKDNAVSLMWTAGPPPRPL